MSLQQMYHLVHHQEHSSFNILDNVDLRFVNVAPLSTTIKSASTKSSPMSVPPSISNVVIGVVPPDNPAPDPVNWLAENQ